MVNEATNQLENDNILNFTEILTDLHLFENNLYWINGGYNEKRSDSFVL